MNWTPLYITLSFLRKSSRLWLKLPWPLTSFDHKSPPPLFTTLLAINLPTWVWLVQFMLPLSLVLLALLPFALDLRPKVPRPLSLDAQPLRPLASDSPDCATDVVALLRPNDLLTICVLAWDILVHVNVPGCWGWLLLLLFFFSFFGLLWTRGIF